MRVASRSPRALAALMAACGALVLGLYWNATRPTLPHRPTTEDMCNHDMARQMMAEQFRDHGGPAFHSDRVMAPYGMDTPFYAGWNVERDWIGSKVWAWNRDFPFYWVYYGISLFACYLTAGFLLGRMGMGRAAAWALALGMTLFNIPRHLKLWHHSDNVMLHWVYAGFLLDAYVWHRFVRERRFPLHVLAWRGVTLLGMLWTMGYMWSPSILVFELTYGAMAVMAFRARGTGTYRLEWNPRKWIAPVLIGAIVLLVDLRWFLPLSRAVRSLDVPQGAGYHVWPDQLLRPLFVERLVMLLGGRLPLVEPWWGPETVTAIGWTWWIPFVLALIALRRAGGRRALIASAPFLCAAAIAICYFTPGVQNLTRPLYFVVPFLRFFRTACRFALFLPALMALAIALAWPELEAQWRRWQESPATARRARALTIGFAVIVTLEGSILLRPPGFFPALPAPTTAMFEHIRALPGDTVLTLPFCVAGANGVCTGEQCAGYPAATAGHCTRLYHDKKVYGSYTSRMTEADCDIYRRAPYAGWQAAWREDRCFSDDDLRGLCDHLATQPGIATVLVLPDVWKAAGTPACEAALAARLGPPIEEGNVWKHATVGGVDGTPVRIRRYGSRCRP